MRLELSPTKNVCCASKFSIGVVVVSQLPEVKFRLARRAKSVGSAITADKHRNSDVLRSRLVAFEARRDQYRKVRRTIGAKRTHMLIQTGGLPALVYGQAVTGVSSSHLLAQRRAVAAAGVTAGAGDLDLTLSIMDGSEHSHADPAFAAHSDPIGAWAEAVWCSWLPLRVLSLLVQRAIELLASASNVWNCVRGPGAAFVASAQRLGWTVKDATSMIDDRGNHISLFRDSPAQVRVLVHRSVRRWRWRRIEDKCPSLCQSDGGYGAHVKPLFKLINCKLIN